MANKKAKDIIKEKYLTTPTTTLSLQLGMKVDTIRKIANRMGLTRRRIISNDIANGVKKCCVCGQILPLSHFSHDKYQPNNYDYRCKVCKKNATILKPKSIKTCPEVSLKGIETCSEDSKSDTTTHSGSMAFGIGKEHNPVIDITDENGNVIKGKMCKVCKNEKPLESFDFANKPKDIRKNICKKCLKEKRIENKKMGIL